MRYYMENEVPICTDCSGNEIRINQCDECGRMVCWHFTDGMNTRLCSNCKDDVKIEKSIIHTHMKVFRKSTGKLLSERRERGKYIKYLPENMILLANRLISMTESEVEEFIEKRKAEISIAEMDLRDRTMHKYAKLREVKLNTSTNGISADGSVVEKRGRKKGSVSAQISLEDQFKVAARAILASRGNKNPTDQEIDAWVMVIKTAQTQAVAAQNSTKV